MTDGGLLMKRYGVDNCPNCGTTLAMSIQPMKDKNGLLRMRPLKEPYLSCPQLACRRVVNTITGDVWHHNKLETKGIL